MIHETKEAAAAARAAALKRENDKRIFEKHSRWAIEMRAAGWRVNAPAREGAKVRDGEGDIWTCGKGGLYRLGARDDDGSGRTREEIEKDYGPVSDV